MQTFFIRLAFVFAALGTAAAQQVVLPDTSNLNPEILSSGARAWLLGPEFTPAAAAAAQARATPSFGTNVDAADPQEDLAAGQSETSIAASGTHVLAAWNDATGFFVQPSTLLRASLTGVSISNDSGATFRDLQGLPNDNPLMQWMGDPTVRTIEANHFIVSSLYLPSRIGCNVVGRRLLAAAVSIATVADDGSVRFTLPIIAVSGGDPCDFRSGPSFIDKTWISYDPNSRTLAMSYTRFGRFPAFGTGQIEMVRAFVPDDPTALNASLFSAPILIQPDEQNVVNQGSYVALAPGGDAYIAWERNFGSNRGNGDPFVYIRAAVVPQGATAPSVGGPDSPRVVTLEQVNSNGIGGVKSLNTVPIPGYNRGPGNDFPRIAFRPSPDTSLPDQVIVVWNDASLHPLGDIWLRALTPTLDFDTPIQKVNDDDSYALHFLPALSVLDDGSISTSWYDRRIGGADSAKTDYFGEIRPAADQDAVDFRITTGSTDWLGTGSLITPNFGDYTDNFSQGSSTFYLWTDGRIGVPQPFADTSDNAIAAQTP